MSENIHAESDKLKKLGSKFFYPSLIYPGLLALWGFLAASSCFMFGHGIDLGLSTSRVFLGFVPFTLPWFITGMILFITADDIKIEEAKDARISNGTYRRYHGM